MSVDFKRLDDLFKELYGPRKVRTIITDREFVDNQLEGLVYTGSALLDLVSGTVPSETEALNRVLLEPYPDHDITCPARCDPEDCDCDGYDCNACQCPGDCDCGVEETLAWHAFFRALDGLIDPETAYWRTFFRELDKRIFPWGI